jgi:hypothetical protein
MQIVCGKCGVKIDVSYHDIEADRFDWGTNNLPKIERECLEWKIPANSAAKISRTCRALEDAIAKHLPVSPVGGTLSSSGQQ